jgi:hypothetical protein
MAEHASGKDVATSAIGIDIGDLPPLPCIFLAA